MPAHSHYQSNDLNPMFHNMLLKSISTCFLATETAMLQLRQLSYGPFESFNKPTEVTYELLTQDGKTFLTYPKPLFPFYPKEPLLFPHIQSKNEQK